MSFKVTHLGLAIAMTLLAGSLPAQAPRAIVLLDQGWRFHTGEIPTAAKETFDDSQWDAITVPHAFPLTGSGDHKGIYRGEAWYRRSFTPIAAWKGKRIFLRFDAVSLVSEVFLNGERLGEHRGGFAAFTYELTGKLRLGENNQLSVRVDNRMNQDVSPLELSLLYGGIYRHVSLIVTGPIDITPMDFSSPGVFLTQTSVNTEQATLSVRTEVDNSLAESHPVSVRLLLIDSQGHPMFKTETTGTLPAKKTTNVDQTVTIPHPHLWNGVADPYLYSVRMDLLDGGQVIDTVTQPLGLRSFHVDPKKGFVLNGVAREIHGACLHQDWGDMGWAIGPAQEQEDLRILREMGADGIRLVHYQHSQSALDLYDRTGMLIWSELAQFGTAGASAAYRDNVRQQLKEMIRQNYNHPSIMMWSLFNELNSKTRDISTPIVKELETLAHAEDPTRPTTGAASGDTIANDHEMIASLDLIADNNYPGWYYGAPEDMGREIDKWNAAYDSRGLAISEYGGGAKIGDHKQNLSVGDVKPYGAFQPEEWQALVHEGNYGAIKSRPVVWGAFIWLAFDTGGLTRSDGTIEGGNIKGLVTQDRKTPKDAYYFYQANWATRPMLYLTSRREVNRTEATTPIKVYSNLPEITLTINGKNYGTQRPNELHVFHWKSVPLDPGENRVEITGGDGLHDEATWTYRAGRP